MNRIKLVMTMLVFVGIATVTYSQLITWDTGGIAGNWNVEDNWNPAGVPGSDDDVAIDLTANDHQLTIPNGYDANVRDLTLNAGPNQGLFISNTGSLTIHGDFEHAAGLLQTRVQTSLLTVLGDYHATAGRIRVLQGPREGVVVEGDLTATDDFSFQFNMNESPVSIKWVEVGGTMTLDNNELILNNFVHNNNDRILLFHNTSQNNVIGSFDIPFGTAFDLYESEIGVGETRQYQLQLVDWDGDGVANDVALIPEPTTLGLILVGLFGLGLRRRFRR